MYWVRNMKALGLILALALLLAVTAIYIGSRIKVTEPCRKYPSGEEVCPTPYKPN